MLIFSIAAHDHRHGALQVWRDANAARYKSPSPMRVKRVRDKLNDDCACLIIATENDRLVAMALAQPARDQDGAGTIRPGVGHVSMVFVTPDRWGQGIGGRLLDALHREMLARGWQTSSLWTGSNNQRAQQLYQRRGYLPTGDVQRHAGEQIVRYQLQIDTRV